MYSDSRPEAVCGYVDGLDERSLKVVFPTELSERITEREKIPSLVEVLRLDPRPSYHDDSQRVYRLLFAGYNIKFTVSAGVLNVTDVTKVDSSETEELQ